MAFDPAKLLTLQAIAFDVDGVLTDGTVTWSESGEESKTFSFADIMGVSLARRLGIKMALISGEPSPLVDRYAKKLHIPFVVKGTRDKATAVSDFAAQYSVPFQEIAFFGDDLNDLFAMELIGLPCCPSNAAEDVLAYVNRRGFVSTFPGGRGAVRELIDELLKARNLDGRDVFQLRPPE
jgi:3-deoxy-D-manno-octulosonate 8-phosphate phosphatase (KDO 8-P phosphatase)